MDQANLKETKCKNCIYSAICSSITIEEVREKCKSFKQGDHIYFVNILDLGNGKYKK